MYFENVTVQTNNIEAARDFYVNHLGFRLVRSEPQELVIKIGKSHLTFMMSTEEKQIYHYAFTIAGNQFEEAKKYFLSKVPLSTENDKDEVYFPFLDARSFYFHDSVGNVVEIIARNSKLKNESEFCIEDIDCMSEINLTVHDVLLQGEKLMNHGFKTLGGDAIKEDSLNFLGEKDAYFLLGPKGRKWFFSHQLAEVSPVKVEMGNGVRLELNKDGIIHVIEKL